MSNNDRARPPVPGPACEYFAPLLPLIGQERLDPRDSSRLRQHLATCGYCQNELENYTWLDDALARHFGPAPRGPLSPADIRELTSRDYRPRTAPPEPLPAPELSRNHRQPRPVAPFRQPRPQPSRRGRRLISVLSALAAVLVIAAVSIALFESRAKPGNGNQQTLTPSPTADSIYFPQPKDALNSLSMTSTGDGWAVGYSFLSAGITESLILHYTGTQWDKISGPTNQSLHAATSSLQRVFMISPGEGWAIGNAGIMQPDNSEVSQAFILHYSGGHWTQQAQTPPNSQLTDIFMTSAHDGWAIGASGVNQGPTSSTDLLLHYDGKNWTQVQAPGGGLSSINMTSAHDGWLVGASAGSLGNSSILLHFDGSRWTQAQKPSAVDEILDLSMVSATDGWLVGLKFLTASTGSTNALFSGTPSKVIFAHYNGNIWTDAQSPLAVNPGQFASVNSLFMNSPTDGWAVGTSTQGNLYLHLSSGKWKQVNGPAGDGLLDVFMLSAGEGWAVGNSGAILHYQHGIWNIPGGDTSTTTPTATPTSTWACSTHSGPNGASSTPGATVAPAPFERWGTYTNTAYHYQLKYPTNWALDNLGCADSAYLAFWNYDDQNWQGPGFPPDGIKIELYALDNPDGLSAMQFFQKEQQNQVGGPPCPAYTTHALQVSGHDAIEAACPAQHIDLYYIPDGASMLRFAQVTGSHVSNSDVLVQMVNSLTFTS
jgi:hypothetical protein